jgi:hypothetical protein
MIGDKLVVDLFAGGGGASTGIRAALGSRARRRAQPLAYGARGPQGEPPRDPSPPDRHLEGEALVISSAGSASLSSGPRRTVFPQGR